MRLANRGCLLLWTPGPVPLGTFIYSFVETILSWTCHVYGPLSFDHPSVLPFCCQWSMKDDHGVHCLRNSNGTSVSFFVVFFHSYTLIMKFWTYSCLYSPVWSPFKPPMLKKDEIVLFIVFFSIKVHSYFLFVHDIKFRMACLDYPSFRLCTCN